MHIKIIGLALAIALLATIGSAYFGVSDTAEAAIHPIVQSQCAAQDSETGAGNKRNPPGQIGNPSTDPGMPHDDVNHPWVDAIANSGENATNGEGSNDHCTNG